MRTIIGTSLLRRVLVVAAISFGVAMGSGAALANHFYAGDGYYFANGNNHYLLYYNLSSAYTTANEQNRVDNVRPTDITDFLTTNHAKADVTVNDGSDGASAALAFEICITPSTVYPDRCNHAHVHHNLSVSLSSRQKKSAACQEVGHSFGLRHQPFVLSSSCMRTNYDLSNTGFDQHDKNSLNGRY